MTIKTAINACGHTLATIAEYGTGTGSDSGCISSGGGAFREVPEGAMLPAFEILQRRTA